MQFQAAEALSKDGAGAAAIQAGLGAGLGMQIGQAAATQAGPWGAAPQAQGAAPVSRQMPPPPPVEHVWHIAENAETRGPYSKAALGRMVTEGALTRETYVWTAGQDGWKKAEDVTELAQLFTVLLPSNGAFSQSPSCVIEPSL
jgi:hypothetical protein